MVRAYLVTAYRYDARETSTAVSVPRQWVNRFLPSRSQSPHKVMLEAWAQVCLLCASHFGL